MKAPLVLLGLLMAPMVFAQSSSVETITGGSYKINPGDVLSLDVWNEPTLSEDTILVRPDGYISVPVVGEIKAGNQTITELQNAIAAGFNRYLRDEPTIVVSILNTNGSQIFVLGKVVRPGAFTLRGPMDVTQALSLAGGLNSFAAENKIKVLRRGADGVQRVIKFKYGQIKDGDNLTSNVLLQSGDLLLVP